MATGERREKNQHGLKKKNRHKRGDLISVRIRECKEISLQ